MNLGLHILHVVARVALRVQKPLRAKQTVDEIGRHFRVFENLTEAQRAATDLDRWGTCLSRALTVAARLPGAEVVIGVDPAAASPLYAHAWVELAGAPLRRDDPGGAEIVRLP